MLLSQKTQKETHLKNKAIFKGNYKFLNIGVTIFSNARETLDIFEKIYHHFKTHNLEEEDITCYIIHSTDTSEGPYIVINGELFPLFEKDSLINRAEMILFQKIIDIIDKHLLFHGGVTSKDGNGFIICGPSQFGKTTLVMELVSRGYKFLSDEYCPVRLADHSIAPFPRSLAIKQGSPFLDRIGKGKGFCFEKKGKIIADCSQIFPLSLGSACRAKYLIMLKGSTRVDTKDKPITIEMYLTDNNQAIIDQLCSHKGVKILGKHQKAVYTGYTFSLQKGQGLVKIFHNLWRKHANEILYVTVVPHQHPDFNGSANLTTMPKSRATIELMKNLLNRSPQSKLFKTFHGNGFKLFCTIADFLKNVDCYEMKTGRLYEMAALVDSL